MTGKAGVSGRGEPPIDVSGSVSERYDENDSSRTYKNPKKKTRTPLIKLNVACHRLYPKERIH